MSFYSTERLWSSEQQNANVFNWTEILEEWNESLTMHPYVQTVIDNLKAAADPDSEYDFPLSHFLKYLNWEKDSITWFLYEAVSMRWMWGESRLDYVKELVHRPDVKLDEGFPVFPGSPRNYRTVRKFLTDSLSEEELEYLEMAPIRPLVTPPRPIRVSAPPPAPVKQKPMYHRIEIDFQRPDVNGKGQPADTITIQRASSSLFNIDYKDNFSDDKVIYKFENFDKHQVLEYVRNVVNLNRIDRQGFVFIQLICPGAPSVIVPQYVTAEERDLMYDAIQRTLENWPVAV